MAQQVSPGIVVNEFDLTTVIPTVSTSTGAAVGVFHWGPLFTPMLITSEPNLGGVFGFPDNFNFQTWFTIASFLAYGAPCQVVRVANTTDVSGANGVLTAYANNAAVTNALSCIVQNPTQYSTLTGTFPTSVNWVARYPGALGNSLRISECLSPNNYTSVVNLASFGQGGTLTLNNGSNVATIVINAASQTLANAACEAFIVAVANTDVLQFGAPPGGIQYISITGINYNAAATTGNTTIGQGTVTLNLQTNYNLANTITNSTNLTRFWQYYSVIGVPPGQSTYVLQHGNTVANDEMHVVVSDGTGLITGVPGQVLEVYQNLSRATDAIDNQGFNNYYANVINQKSQWVWFTNDLTTAVSNTSNNVVSATTPAPVVYQFSGGADGPNESNVSVGTLTTGIDKFISTEAIDISLAMVGLGLGGINGTLLANYWINNIALTRKDCVVFMSPQYTDVVYNIGFELTSVVATRNQLVNTSYGFMDSGYKLMYDRYNNLNRWVPLNGDMAGLCALTDQTNNPWWSPAGFNRGQIRNIIQLAWNPNKPQRDVMYPLGVNPVVSFAAQGTILYGDHTLLTKPSAFNRINVRRLFIVLEEAIALATQYLLFEFNDAFTQATFRNMVNPYLRGIKGQRGITDFLVVCDATNNTPQIVDTNQFVGDIYIKPARSINFITLNFVAVPTGVAFSEVVGQFGATQAVT